MTRRANNKLVEMAFEKEVTRIGIDYIHPLYLVTAATRQTVKYKRIAASIREIGVIEPIVVARDRSEPRKYLLLDGHLRLDVLKDRGATEIDCLISTDDEAFTYNKRISRLAIIQEHKMILKAIERGVPQARLARALNINVSSLQEKTRLLDGICPEAAELLKDKHVSMTGFRVLKKMTSVRQIEAAELMVAMNKYTVSYARSLLAATPLAQLKDPAMPKAIRGVSKEQIAMMERESANLEREVRLAERTYGADHLDLVLARGYVAKLIGNARIVRYLAQNHTEFLPEFQRIAEVDVPVS
jgi:ParB-like chromosome segregation protein Spo0J